MSGDTSLASSVLFRGSTPMELGDADPLFRLCAKSDHTPDLLNRLDAISELPPDSRREKGKALLQDALKSLS